jgi:nucleoside-diphosphate-sugar epimerase
MERIKILTNHLISNNLWDGDAKSRKKAIQNYLDTGVTNFPLLNIQNEYKLNEKKMFKILEKNERDNKLPNTSRILMKNVLITGSTGFVGIHLLARLLQLYPLNKFYCLIRGNDILHCRKRLIKIAKGYGLENIIENNSRIYYIPGNINELKLGIENYNNYLYNIDTVMHLAAKDNYFLPYQALKIHTKGLLSIIDFCTKYKTKTLIYFSSCAINLVDSLNGKIIENKGLYNGYSQGKFIAHKLIEKLYSLYYNYKCIPYIYPINLGYIFPYYNLDLDLPELIIPNITDSVEVIFKICLIENVVPDINVPIDYTPINYIINCILEIINLKKYDDIKWFNLYNPNPLYFKDISDIICQRKNVKKISLNEFVKIWRNKLNNKDNYKHKFLATLVTEYFEQQMNKIFLLNNTYKSKINTIEKIDKQYLNKLVDLIDNKMIIE